VYKFLTPTEETPTARYPPIPCLLARLFDTVKAYVEHLGPSDSLTAFRSGDGGDQARKGRRVMPPEDTMALMAFLRLVQSLVRLPQIREQVVDDPWKGREVGGPWCCGVQ